MKINFTLPTDGKRHRYCQNCHSENVHNETVEDKRLYKCDNCGNSYDRLIDIDPALSWWIDEKTKEYWHESVGIFVYRKDGRILFFERTIYPYGFTIPAGHLEKGEIPESSARRELEEEAGIKAPKVHLFKEENIEKDLCRRGADFHRWHIFNYLLEDDVKIITGKEEGKNPVWLSVDESLQRKLTPTIKFLLEKYVDKLIQ